MDLQNDFKELLELLNDHEVDYLIVDGYAVAHTMINSVAFLCVD